MKIAIVTKNMLGGGAERVLHNLISKWLEHNDLEVSLILTNDRQSIFYSIPKECKVDIISSNKKNIYLEKIDRFKKLRKIIKKIKPDIVLSMPEEIGIYVLIALFGTGIPIVVSERNNPWVMPYKKVTRLLRKLMYPHAKGLIFQTKQAASFFPEKIQRKGVVLPNPLDIDNLPDAYFGERERVIVGCGRLDIQKNFPLLIDAFADFHINHSDYKLIIYGEGHLRNELEQYAKDKNLPVDAITFPGRVTNLPEVLRTKAMFVLSSDYEGMPNVVIEAMAMGVPVIATDCPSGGCAELIENEKSGILIPVGDKESMTDAMCSLADDYELSQRLSLNGPDIRKTLDSQVVSERWMEFLRVCCHKDQS